MIGWIAAFVSVAFMLPWARWLLHRSEARAFFPNDNPLLLVLTTVGLSVGTLSLVMLWIGLLGRPIDWRVAALVCAIIGASGLLLRDKLLLIPGDPLLATPPKPLRNVGVAAWIVLGVIATLILFNALYWPFGIDDAVTIYATFGKSIAATQQLPTGTLYELYPMLTPLNYAFVFQASGWTNEYAAALYPVILSIGVIGVAYLLGRELFNRAAGLIAALLLALTPMITHWSSTGYADLPAAFYFGMTALFLARLQRTGAWADALLAGIMAGLAAWTKNSALIVVVPIGLWVVYNIRQRRPLQLRHVLMIGGTFLAVAGPWYLRDILIAGTPLPPTGWIWKAERTVPNLFPYLVDDRYGIIGLVLTIGLGYILWRVWKSRGGEEWPVFLFIFTLPFFAVWWALFSYDKRFLLLLSPLVAVMGALIIQEAWRRFPVPSRLLYLPWAIPLIIVLALPAASAAIDFKFDILRHPFMSDATKHRLKLGTDRYDMAVYLRSLPAGSRIWTQDYMLPFNADGMFMTVGGWPTLDMVAGYDYWMRSPGDNLPDWVTADQPVHSEGDYQLYKVPH